MFTISSLNKLDKFINLCYNKYIKGKDENKVLEKVIKMFNFFKFGRLHKTTNSNTNGGVMLEETKPMCNNTQARVIDKEERKIRSLEAQAKSDPMLRMYLYGRSRG